MDRKTAWTLVGALFALVVLGVAAMALLALAVGGRIGGGGARVGLVRLSGPIHGSDKVVEQLWEVAEGDVAGVVLRIDSPGGAVGPSQEVFEAVRRVRDETEKPVVASMGSVAASGGYYAALGCDRIVANPGTLTGSIGVIVQTMHAPDLLTLARIDQETVKSGSLKDAGSPFRDMSDGDRALFAGVVADVFDQFRGAVQEGRKLDDAAFEKVADGRVLTGRQAHELGLVDELGNLGRAGRLVLELAGEEVSRPTWVTPKDDVPGWVRGLFADTASRAAGEVVRQVVEEGAGARVLMRAPIR